MYFNNIFALIFLIIFIYLSYIYKNNNLKVALCTMGKKENLYIKEFVDYYLNLGIDHIFIYDNNEPNTEKISDVINRPYKNKVTIFENISDKITSQPIAFTNCYNENKYNYDWVFMIDIDEYLILKNDSLKNYLSNEIFKNCDFIKIHWLVATDNNFLHYDKRPLLKRFRGPFLNDTHIKTFLRGNIEQLKYDIHSPIESPIRNRTCDNAGNKYNYSNNNANALNDLFEINHNKAYIIHFKYKSTEEFINKYKRGYRNWFGSDFLPLRIKEYFTDNKITLEKIEYMENELKLNLSEYKLKLISNYSSKI